MEIEKNFLEDYISVVYENTNLKEGEACITHFLTSLYLNPHISTRDLSLALFIPVPVATAIKKEFQKCGLVLQERGVVLSDKGIEFVEEELGYKGVYRDKLYQILQNEDIRKRQIDELAIKYKGVFEDRPSVDVTVDQAKGTPETAFKRAMLCLETGSLIGKKLLCVGDDDLVSIALGLLLKELGVKSHKTEICVFDIDDRYINYIESIATLMDLPVKCYHTDLREPLPLHYTDYFDAFFTDPPYTLNGLSLFLSRGVSVLKKKRTSCFPILWE